MNRFGLIVVCSIVIGLPGAIQAGMPSPLPSGDELVKVFKLNESADQRLQVISFFTAGILFCAAAIRWMWNYLASGITALPKLTYSKALVGVVLWGLLFVIVLTMISGARELMTPGAWKKQGFTYKLNETDNAKSDPDPMTVRLAQLEKLRYELWQFAATHDGRFPSDTERAGIAPELWVVPETPGLRYKYFENLSVKAPIKPLVVSPAIDNGRRLVLRTDGTVADISAAEGDPALQAVNRP